MDKKVTSTPGQQNQKPKRTIEMQVVEVKNPSHITGAVSQSASRGKLPLVRGAKKDSKRAREQLHSPALQVSSQQQSANSYQSTNSWHQSHNSQGKQQQHQLQAQSLQ